jgi:hypothetical protein
MRYLSAPALISLPMGAVGSLGFMLWVGRHNHSRLLTAIFTLWVLFPFVALVWAHVVSKRWPPFTRATLHCVTLVVALASVAIYGMVAFGPPRAKTAAPFVIVPPACCLLIAIALPIAALVQKRFVPKA